MPNDYAAISVEALAGGDVEMPLVTQITGTVSLESNAKDSVLDLSALESLTAMADRSLSYTQGGAVTDPNLTTFANVKVTTDPTATFSVPATETFSFPSSTTTINTGTVLDQGDVSVQSNAILKINGGLTIDVQGALSTTASSSLDVSGNLLGNTMNAAEFDRRRARWHSTARARAVRHSSWKPCRRTSETLRPDINQNFAYATLQLTSSTYVKLVDESANSSGSAPNAVYVNSLIVPSGATLNLNGLHLYALHTTDQRNDHRWYGSHRDGQVDFDGQRELECRQQLEHRRCTHREWNVVIDVSRGHTDHHDQLGLRSRSIDHGQRPLSITGGSLTVGGDFDDQRRALDDGRVAEADRGRGSRSRSRGRPRYPARTSMPRAGRP